MKATVYTALVVSAIAWMTPAQAENDGPSTLPAIAAPVQTLDSAIEKFGKEQSALSQGSVAGDSTAIQSQFQAPANPAFAPNPALTATPPANKRTLPAESGSPQSISQTMSPPPVSAAPNFRNPIVFVYEFSAGWCPSCRKLAPIVEEATSKYDGFAEHIPINVDKNQDLVQKLNVAQIPTVIVVDKRGRMLNRLVGLQQGKQIDAILEHYKSQTIASLNRNRTR